MNDSTEHNEEPVVEQISSTTQLVRILEGILFAAEKPLSINQLLTLFEEGEAPERTKVKEALDEMTAFYVDRGIVLKELASGYQFQVCSDLSKWVQRMHSEKPPRYSRAMMETLALIAYRQPITRGEIEEIRGVAVSSNIVKAFLERDWVKVIGHRDVPGRPALLATTKTFLDYFGLKKLEDLPPLSELEDLDKAGEKLEQQLQEEQALSDEQADEADIDEPSSQQEGVEALSEHAHEMALEAEEDEAVDEVDLDDTGNLFAEIDEALKQATDKVDAFLHPETEAEEEQIMSESEAEVSETAEQAPQSDEHQTLEQDNENRETTEITS